MKYLALTFLSVLLIGCPEDPNEPDTILKIINNSNSNVVIINKFSNFNDTSLKIIPFPLTTSNTQARTILLKNEKDFNDNFKSTFKKFPDNFLTVFFFNPDTIAQVPWEEIVERESKLRVSQYSLEQLKALNWTITYP